MTPKIFKNYISKSIPKLKKPTNIFQASNQ